MSFSVNTNTGAMAAIQILGQTNKTLDMIQERVNSGYRVNGARDNASTFAIAEGMRSDVSGLSAVTDQLNMAESVAQVAVTAGERILNKLEELETEVIKATDPTANNGFIQETIDSLIADIDAIAASAQFNGVNLIDGSDGNQTFTSSLNRTDPNTVTLSTITLNATNLTTAGTGINGTNVEDAPAVVEFDDSFATQVTSADNGQIEFGVDEDGDGVADTTYTFEFVDDLAADTLTNADHIGVEFTAGDPQGVTVAALMAAMRDNGFSVDYNAQGQLSVTHSDGAIVASAAAGTLTAGTNLTITNGAAADLGAQLGNLTAARDTIATALSQLGTAANRLSSQREFVEALSDSLEGGIGALVDANMAEESARLQAYQTKQQLGIQALSIANQAPQSVLALFQ